MLARSLGRTEEVVARGISSSQISFIESKDREQRIETIVAHNLTTNEPWVDTLVGYEKIRLPKVTVWNKIAGFKSYLLSQYQGCEELLISIAIIAVASVMAVLTAYCISGALGVHYAQILRGEITYI